MGGFLVPIFEVVDLILRIYMWIVIASAVMSWLISFRVINTYSRPVSIIGDFIYRATEPVYRPLRRFLPNIGGLDVTPVVVLIAIWLIRMELWNLIFYVYRI
ncbi:MAG: YggT family protein [Stellaceae bacterium]